MKIKKSIIVLLASLAFAPLGVEAKDSGKIGDLKWSFKDSTLTISGVGKMPDSIGDIISPPVQQKPERGQAIVSRKVTFPLECRSVVIEEGATSIGMMAFTGCKTLVSVVIPESVASIGAMAFVGCENLASVELKGATPPKLGMELFKVNPFGDELSSITLCVPKGAKSVYADAEGWKDFGNIREMDSNAHAQEDAKSEGKEATTPPSRPAVQQQTDAPPTADASKEGDHGEKKTGDIKQRAIQLLGRLEKAAPVAKEENLVGLSIASVKKSGDDYIVRWASTNDMIEKNPGNQAFLLTQIYYIDPEKYEHHYQPFTVEDGKINRTFAAGDEISNQVARVKFEPASKIMFVYFKGVDKSPQNPATLYTVPLFFTIVLGDEPYVLEETPRHAGTMFSEALKQ